MQFFSGSNMEILRIDYYMDFLIDRSWILDRPLKNKWKMKKYKNKKINFLIKKKNKIKMKWKKKYLKKYNNKQLKN